MKIGYIFIFFSLFISSVSAQNTFSGTITSSDNKPLEGVIVTITDASNEMLGYQITNNKGFFLAEISSSEKEVIVCVNLLGYESKNIKLSNKTQTVNISLVAKEITLKEVNIEGRPLVMRNDTLSYNVDAFKNKQDRTIGDVLKKLPGIEVLNNGAIKYKGEMINKFYINGMDLLDKKYGLATQNVPVNAVTNVEVLENHQPFKVLKGIQSTGKAAINLKLSDKAKAPVGTAEAGIGKESSDILWLLNLFMMKMGDNNQTLTYYKTNNTGIDIAKEMTSHTDFGNYQDFYKWSKFDHTDLFNTKSFSAMELSPKRYLFNKTHAVTINNLKKINEEKQLRVNLNYLNDKREEYISQETSYYLPEGDIRISEINQLNRESNILDGGINFNKNSSKSYINNDTKFNFKWENTYSDIIQDMIPINQKYSTPKINLSNDFQYVKRNESTLYDLTSYIRYTNLPQKFKFRLDTLNYEPQQHIDYEGLYTYNSTYFTYTKGRSAFMVQLTMEGGIESLSSRLEHHYFTDSIYNDLKSNFIKLDVIPSYSYQKNRFSFRMAVPLKQYVLNNKDKKLNRNKTEHPFLIEPQASVRYRFNPYLESNLSYRYSKSLGDIFDYPTSIMMHDYRSFTSEPAILSEDKKNTVRLNVNYRNPLKILFINSMLSYSNGQKNLMSSQYFFNKELILSRQKQNNSTKMWNWLFNSSKYVTGIKTNFILNGGVISLKSKKIQQNRLYPAKNLTCHISPGMNIKVSDQMGIQYLANYSKSILNIISAKSSSSQFSQSLNAFYVFRNLELSIQAEHLRNDIDQNGNSMNIYFADLNLKYIHKQFEASFAWNNIFNKKSYAYTSFSGLDTYSYYYRLRPSNILVSVSFRY